VQDDAPTLPTRGDYVAALIVVAILAVVAYGVSLRNDFVSFDDGLLIYDNPTVKEVSFHAVVRAFTTYDPELYVPLTLLTYQGEHLIAGFHPFIYHVTNLLLHILNASLVFLFVRFLFADRRVAWIAAILFTVHPLHAEAVAWAAARKDLLATFFALLSLNAYCFYRRTNGARAYGASIAFFLAALLSKVVVLFLPFVLLAIDFREKRRLSRAVFLEKAPYFFLSAILLIVALNGKAEQIGETTFFQKILMAGKSTMFLLEKFIAPVHLSVIYPFIGSITLSSTAFSIPWIVLTMIAIVVLISLRTTREFFFAALFAAFFLAPSLVNFSKGGALYIASDRYLYLASVSLFSMIGFFLVSWIDAATTAKGARSRERTVQFIVGIVACFFVIGAYHQSKVWANSETLFRYVLTYYPDSFVAHNNIGNVYRRDGLNEKALEEFEAAEKLQPNNAAVHTNIGVVKRLLGRTDEAIQEYETAMQLDPSYVDAPYNMGYLFMQSGDEQKAEEWFKRAIAAQPSHVRSRINLGALYTQQHNLPAAEKILREAIALNPDFPEPYYNLGIVREQQGDRREAEELYRAAIAHQSDYVDAYNNLGALMSDEGRYEEAVAEFKKVLAIDPQNETAVQNLQAILHAIGR
jgi:tetratricopeptide (TPR) repeat protein